MPKRPKKGAVAVNPAIVESEAIKLLSMMLTANVHGQPANRVVIALTVVLSDTIVQAAENDATRSGAMLAEVKALLEQKTFEALVRRQMIAGADKS